MSKYLHGAWLVALIAVALLVYGWQERRVGAANQRARTTQDSLTAALHVRDSVEAAALQAVAVQQARERQQVAQLTQARQATDAQQRAQEAITASLRETLNGAQQRTIDSLTAAQALLVASLEAQRDTALRLFRGAAAQRDTLAALLVASQQARAALQVALVASQRKPFLERGIQGSIVKIVRTGLEVRGLVAIVTGR